MSSGTNGSTTKKVTYPGVWFSSGDGQSISRTGDFGWIIPGLSVGQAKELSADLDAISSPADDSQKAVDRMIEHHVPVIHAAMQRNYPDLTVDQVKSFVDQNNFGEVLAAALGRSKDPKTRDPGETQPVDGRSSTGTTSTGASSPSSTGPSTTSIPN
jgi:hypothetical protein